MDSNTKVDVIVVGAGPSGVACAITVAKANHSVLVIEKAPEYGTKNMFGGAVYLNSLKELLGEKYKDIPYEKYITKHNYVLLANNDATSISYSSEKKDSATITRYNFDNFLVQEAEKCGVYFAKNTVAVDVIKKDNRVVGVKTENEEIYSNVVVLAEGFNSILAEKIGLKKKINPKYAIVAVKETIKLPKDLINERFNLSENDGAEYQFFGGLTENEDEVPFAMGFLYTYKNFVSLGLGISMESLKNGKTKPHEYLERLKSNKFVKTLIKDGEVTEFSAHSIPETGYNNLPKLYDDGVLLVGDAAGLVDAVHFEGTNLGIKSGILAGETCNLAMKKGDYSKAVLKKYKKDIYKTFIINDLKTYKDVIPTLFKRRKSIFLYYPKKINEFFSLWTAADDKGKKRGYKKFLASFIFKRNLLETIKDVISFVKCIIGALV